MHPTTDPARIAARAIRPKADDLAPYQAAYVTITLSVRGLVYLTAGHAAHHLEVLRARYLLER